MSNQLMPERQKDTTDCRHEEVATMLGREAPLTHDGF